MFKRLHFLIKNFVGYIIFISLFIIHPPAVAQKNASFYEDSIFNKYADFTVHHDAYTKLYYIIQSKQLIPASVKVIRKIEERISIIEVNSKNEFDSLQQRIKISAANNSWKFSPALEKIMEEKHGGGIQKYILTGHPVDS